MGKKIAVVGAGLYGITTALGLSKYFEVDLFEKNRSILTAASGINQYRLHRGYHYPRSDANVLDSVSSERLFEEIYGEAIMKDNESYYCIANEGSLTSKEAFIDFCHKHGLEFEESDIDFVKKDRVHLIAKVKEHSVDPIKLKSICSKMLAKSGVNLIFNTEVTLDMLKEYDYIINCTYSHLNNLLAGHHLAHLQRDFRFQLCEKPVAELPEGLRDKNIVVIDGPFTCADRLGRTGLSVMGHVVHAVHHSNIGKCPEVPYVFASLLNQGILKNPPITNFNKFIESASEYFPEIRKAKHVGSMYTIRAVLPNVSSTDERPVIVEKVDDRIINAFAGKLTGCVLASEKILNIITKENEIIKEA